MEILGAHISGKMVLHGIDQFLRMFHPHTKSERFCFNKDFFLMQQLKYIPGRMAGSQNHRIRSIRNSVCRMHICDTVPGILPSEEFRIKKVLTSAGHYKKANGGDDLRKLI